MLSVVPWQIPEGIADKHGQRAGEAAVGWSFESHAVPEVTSGTPANPDAVAGGVGGEVAQMGGPKRKLSPVGLSPGEADDPYEELAKWRCLGCSTKHQVRSFVAPTPHTSCLGV